MIQRVLDAHNCNTSVLFTELQNRNESEEVPDVDMELVQLMETLGHLILRPLLLEQKNEREEPNVELQVRQLMQIAHFYDPTSGWSGMAQLCAHQRKARACQGWLEAGQSQLTTSSLDLDHKVFRIYQNESWFQHLVKDLR